MIHHSLDHVEHHPLPWSFSNSVDHCSPLFCDADILASINEQEQVIFACVHASYYT